MSRRESFLTKILAYLQLFSPYQSIQTNQSFVQIGDDEYTFLLCLCLYGLYYEVDLETPIQCLLNSHGLRTIHQLNHLHYKQPWNFGYQLIPEGKKIMAPFGLAVFGLFFKNSTVAFRFLNTSSFGLVVFGAVFQKLHISLGIMPLSWRAPNSEIKTIPFERKLDLKLNNALLANFAEVQTLCLPISSDFLLD